MSKGMIHVKVLLPNGKTAIYLLAKKISKGLYWDYKMSGNKSVFQMLKGCYITVPISQYNEKRQAKMTTGKIMAVFWKHRKKEALFTRSQFVTEEHLARSLKECYRYLRHDYDRMSRGRIFLSLAYWKFASKKVKQKNRQGKAKQPIRLQQQMNCNRKAPT